MKDTPAVANEMSNAASVVSYYIGSIVSSTCLLLLLLWYGDLPTVAAVAVPCNDKKDRSGKSTLGLSHLGPTR